MKLEDTLKKFLPKSISPVSIESLANNLENIGKAGAGLLALLYVVGLIIFGLYHSALHIRSIEFFKVKYLFVGFYYFAFLFLHLFYPTWWIKKSPAKILYLFVALIVIVFLNDVNNTYLTFVMDNWISGKSYFEFKNDHISVINGNLSILVMAFLLAKIALSLAIKAKQSNEKSMQNISFLLIASAIIFNYMVFTKFVFPYIPDAIGGGKAPIVSIEFNKDVPFAITSNFDIEGKVPGYTSPFYFARLVYKDNNSVFLMEPFWFSNDVYELQSSDIRMIWYTDFNPVQLGQPGLFP